MMRPIVRRSGQAQALVWLMLAIPMLVSVAGLAIDGSVLLDERRQLQSVVDGAARAGATQMDMPRLRASGGSDIQLDPTLASRAARTYVDQALGTGPRYWNTPPDVDVAVGTRRIRVTLRARLATAFLRIVNISELPVEADATADVQYGIHDGGGG
jgi:Flp pilus assembly protein TadG